MGCANAINRNKYILSKPLFYFLEREELKQIDEENALKAQQQREEKKASRVPSYFELMKAAETELKFLK